ncbi:PREDICTED: uncharacterized protein LOC104735281 [Camelina sativa]|uniref:Uncharacterized protein LOC104735281 n=1 Tax=Camelina sativa TaxID=90675 RepID=A0ABM0VAH6_CAMSA|nr:PREDICTED: uncharacterized protein LOC104735281 [Camelina sativa]
MDEPGSNLDPGSYPIPPASVHLSPFSSSLVPPPLSTHFTRRRCQPLQSSRRLAYISLQGLLVNSEEASSARSIGGGLSRDETLAWELFTPYQRFLIVAVIGVAASESKKNGLIRQLQKSVDLRDQVLSSMQQKLDDLCQQLNLVKDQSGTGTKVSDHDDDLQPTFKEKFGSERINFVDCGCWLCDQHHHSSPVVIQDKVPTNLVIDAEPEERRMSYMSDWCSSVTSAAENHFDSLSLDQDMLSLRKECQEKDATIKDLTSFLQSTTKAGSKRETELEEIIRRKKTIIKKLKRDVLVLEEKVTQLTKLRRSSYSAAVSNTHEFPMRMDNLLYDMDLLTTSSSSDSEATVDTPQRAVTEAPLDFIKEEELKAVGQIHKSAPAKSSTSLVKSVKLPSVVSPSTTRKPVSVSSSSSRIKRGSSTSDSKKPKRPIQTTPRESSGLHKRWV